MACQKIYKQGRDEYKCDEYTIPCPYTFLHYIQLHSSVKKMQGWSFGYLPSLLYSSLPCLHTFQCVIPTSFKIFNVYIFSYCMECICGRTVSQNTLNLNG